MTDKKLIITGIAKYFRIGSKGTRYSLIIDDIEIPEHIKSKMLKSEPEEKSKTIQQIIRNKKIELKLK